MSLLEEIQTAAAMEKRVEYYDADNRRLKTQWIPEVREIAASEHKWWALRREVFNHQTQHRTILTFDSIETGKAVSNDMFTPRYLEREQ